MNLHVLRLREHPGGGAADGGQRLVKGGGGGEEGRGDWLNLGQRVFLRTLSSSPSGSMALSATPPALRCLGARGWDAGDGRVRIWEAVRHGWMKNEQSAW